MRVATLLTLLIALAVSCYAAAAALGLASDGVSVTTGGGTNRRDFLVAAASGLAFSISLWRLVRMLRLVEKGEVFARSTIAELHGFALFVLFSALIAILLPAAFAVGDALASEPGERSVTLTFDGGDFFSLLISALLFFLVRLLGEAQRISEDASQIV